MFGKMELGRHVFGRLRGCVDDRKPFSASRANWQEFPVVIWSFALQSPEELAPEGHQGMSSNLSWAICAR